ncbi:MAG: SUMF1/EgtB/PvdO family nonheme iron enzyme [Candidatus Rokuibacteriota bacterium]
MASLRSVLLGAAVAGALGAAAGGAAWAQSLETMRSEKRHALVIGNARYQSAPLRNPVNDARAMTAALRRAGFQVVAVEDAAQREMRRAILDFGHRLREGGVGLFYFAGHGLQVNGRNYLVPIDAQIESEAEVEVEAVDVASVLARMETARNRLNIVVLDACRDNPFARSFRSTSKGLASIDAPSGTMIAYATAPGRVARDGTGSNGLYTGELVKTIAAPGVKIEDMFKKVRQVVSAQTRGEQVPWESSSLVGDFIFVLPGAAPPASPPPVTPPAAVPPAIAARPPDTRELPRPEVVGSLSLSASVDGVEVSVGSRRIGEATGGVPLVISLQPGIHRVTARKAGHREWQRDVQIAANQSASLMIDIEPLRSEGAGVVRGEDGVEMVLIPAGEFWMGDDAEERTRPRRRIHVDAYYLDKLEVSNAQFGRFISAGGYDRQAAWSEAGWQWRASQPSVVGQPKFWTDAKWNQPTQPVVGVSWYEADAYCRFVGKRLPTEAEWEKAARGPEGRRYPWGDAMELGRANTDESRTGRTAPVGSHASGASPYGVHDMVGNAAEWVADWYSKEYYRVSPERNPPGPSAGGDKVVRGGSWDNKLKDLQSAARRDDRPSERGRKIGFRCADH